MNKNVFRNEICSYCSNRCPRKCFEHRLKYKVEYIFKRKTKILKCEFYIKKVMF